MTDYGKKQHGSVKKWIAEQEPKDRKFLRELWGEGSQPAFQQQEEIDITDQEIDQALSRVHQAIEPDEAREDNTGNFNVFPLWPKLAAAAILLIILATGYVLYPRTHYAPYGEIATAELPDGSTVQLNSGSEISYNGLFGTTNREISLEGEGYFSVRTADEPFLVEANKTTIEVMGTAFNARSWTDDPSEKTEVAVSEGSVSFFPGSRRELAVRLGEGEKSRWSSEMEHPVPAEEIELEKIAEWRDKKLNFNNQHLEAIFKELERRFDVQIDLEAESMAGETLTAYYSEPKSAESVIEDICRVKGLNYAPTANGFRVYE